MFTYTMGGAILDTQSCAEGEMSLSIWLVINKEAMYLDLTGVLLIELSFANFWLFNQKLANDKIDRQCQHILKICKSGNFINDLFGLTAFLWFGVAKWNWLPQNIPWRHFSWISSILPPQITGTQLSRKGLLMR